MSGGIIIQRNAVLLTAIQDPSMYASLDPRTKAAVDKVAAKSPDKRDKTDVHCLLNALIYAANS